jgi:hypothetical protein
VRRISPQYTPYTRHNPYFLTGDFDGDGRTDIAIWVRNVKTGEVGLIVVHRADESIHILGAGHPFGDRGKDFRWFDLWSLYTKGPIPKSAYQPASLNLIGDAIWVAKAESASAFIYWDGNQYTWYQESD